MKNAARIGFRAAIRTFSQGMAGGLASVTVVSLSTADMEKAGTTAVIVTIGAFIGAVIAFCQNFGENIPEPTEV